MVVSTMKKITLLAEKEYLKPVMISLQSLQAVELITTTADIQRGLVNKYYDEDEATSQEDSSNQHVFENVSTESEVNQLKHRLDEVEEAIEFLEEIIPSPGLLEKLRFEKETYSLDEIEKQMESVNIQSLISEAEGIRSRINELNDKKLDLEEEREFLNRWRSLDFNPKLVEHTKVTEVFIGAIDTERNEALHEALDHFNDIYVEELNYTEDETIYLVITSSHDADDVKNTLIRHRFERLHYHYDSLPREELKRNKEDLNDVTEKIAHVEEKPEDYKKLLNQLKLAEEYLYNRRERLSAMQNVLISENLFVLTGWIEEDEYETQLEDIGNRVSKEHVLVSVEDVKDNEVEDVPVKLKNRESTSAFEGVVEMFSLPKYNEIDPTAFVQPFSILFFGMMTADAGYGLLGLIAIFFALKFLDLSKSLEKNLKFFGQLMIGTTLAGLFFGSFFGFELPFQIMSLNDQILEIMILSIGIGIVHLLLGLFLNTVLKNRENNYAESFTGGYSWMLILLSVVAMAVNAFLGGPAIVNTIAISAILLSLLVTIIISIVSNDNKVEGVVDGVFSIFDVTGYIGDVISYTRLTALGIASANIAMAFNLVIGLLPVWARFTIGILLFVALHLFNMFIAMISGYVHTLRLNYVEFFGKFYEGGGREFAPIPMLQKHILIKNNTTI